MKTSVYCRALFDQFVPRTLCALCGQLSSERLCPGCHRDLPWLESFCSQCAEPLPNDSAERRCGRCLKSAPAFTRTLSPLRYQYPVNHLVAGIKQDGDLGLFNLARDLFIQRHASAIAAEPPELLVPVPLHSRRERQRGYNQAEVWARLLGSQLAIAVAPRCCERRLHTPHQQGLSARDRRRNLRRAFTVKPGFRARHIALVDDVITTGTTLDLLAQAFRRQGVERIDAWCLARTPGPANRS
ncbi:ComF family protein [Motiliproteus sp. SC1-56]|uniref:ComF family protein n=1 Tax=Motiliproteus sp. SC1-56 TaxID=2799565 RepID=UPI001A8E49D3|nr:ComF family protein [Motiliproteus sp. SC1-56]